MGWLNKIKDSVQNFVSSPVEHINNLIGDTKDFITNNTEMLGAGAGYTAAALGAGAALGPLAPAALAGLGYLGGHFAPDVGNYISNRGSALIDNLTGYTANQQFEKTLAQSQEQFNTNVDLQLNQYRNMVKDMSAAGLSPLSSLSASPAGGVSGNTASPTASGSSIGQLAGLISPLIGAVVNKSIANADNQTRMAIAQIQASQSGRNADTSATTARRGQDLMRPVQEATARNANASAANQEYETEYKKSHGYSSETPDTVKTGREVVSAVKEVADAVDEQNARSSVKTSETARTDAKRLFDAVSNGSEKLYTANNKGYNFGQLYTMWQVSRSGMSFEEFLQHMIPRQMSAYYEREKR